MSSAPPREPDEPAGASAPAGRRRLRIWPYVLGALATALLTVGILALLFNIFERKTEGQDVAFKVVQLDENTVDPAVWGKNYPIQYDLYRKTTDQVRTRHGGSEAIPQKPSQTDPRDTVAQDKLAEDTRLVKIWAGYAFSKDFREERGHAYMLIDQRTTKRVQVVNQPGACLNCHASMPKLYKDLGGGDTMAGFAKLNATPYADATKLVQHPVACIDCHDPATMELRVTRPAFIEGMKVLKASQGVKDYDVNRDATAQEKRAFVCGQCHVEYYFKGKQTKTLTFPWNNGLTVQGAMKYYDDEKFKDFTHKVTGATVLKAQHPEFETWSNGIHAKNGVTCADCHMPYLRVGGVKVSDHQVRSPMLNINASCQTCHKADEAEIKSRVDTIQSRFLSSRDVGWNAVVNLIDDIDAAQKAGAPAARLDAARGYQRRAQFYLDYVEAENSAGFHASGYSLSVINLVTDNARLGQLALLGKTPADAEKPSIVVPEPPGAASATPTPSPSK